MKLLLPRLAILCGAVTIFPLATLRAAEAPAAAPKPDDVICKGKGLEIKQAELDKRIMQAEAGAKAQGRSIPPEQKTMMRQQLLDQMVTTKLLLAKANDTDRKKGKEDADKFMADLPARAGGEEALKKQLADSSTTLDEVRATILEQATSAQVLDREMQTLIKVTDEDAKKFFEENPAQF
ncbi:MAG TPA: SurA N-terminal domain-containing protein, partial [Verrucomicrobiae bacterium]|nr:SurA N-terminal domain-containing protein [Verrucomicrobiae bacterium]